MEDLPKTDGFYSLYLKETMDALSPLYQENQQILETKGFKDFLGVAHISANTERSKGMDWAARDSALPLITAGQIPVFIAESNTIPALYRPEFNPREIVFLPAAASAQITASRTDAKIISQSIQAQRVMATVETSAPAMLVIAQAFYHPWRADVDGQPVKLWRANAAFQALEIPAGRHEIKLAYVDRVFQTGAGISVASLIVLGLTWFRSREKTS